MRGLLEKELLLLKGQRNFFLILLVITVFLGFNSSDNFVTTYLTFCAGFLTISSFGYDDNGNCMPFLMTLPVSRQLYVKSKYVLGALVTSTGWLCGMVITLFVAFVKGQMPAPENLAFQLAWLLLWMMVMAFTLPPMFKYGAEKGRMVLLAIMVIFLAIGYIGVKASEQMGIDLDAAVAALSGFGTVAPVAAMAVLALVLVWVSCLISMKIVQNKEY